MVMPMGYLYYYRICNFFMREGEQRRWAIEVGEGKRIYKPFQIVQSPETVAKICELSRDECANLKDAQFKFEDLLKIKRGPSVKKVSGSREAYRNIKEKLTDKLRNFTQSVENLDMAGVLVTKQEILTNFLSDFAIELSKECKQKSDILLFLWNSIFNVIQTLVTALGKVSARDEKQYLTNLLANHQDYQAMIEGLKKKMQKKESKYSQQQQFIKALVYNLRYKRKEVGKLSKNLKLCNMKLNQIKNCYLDLQLEYIQLLSEKRDISKENALNMLKRKQELNQEKRVEYKIKQSQKKIKVQIQSELNHENHNEKDHVEMLNRELQDKFNRFQEKAKIEKESRKVRVVQGAQLIFQNALDDFSVRVDSVPSTHSIIDFKNNTGIVDMATDMDGFQLDAQEVETQTSQRDRRFYDFISDAAVQTAQIKTKVVYFNEEAVQVNQNELKKHNMSRVKVLEKSYLLEDYKDKKYKMDMGMGFKLSSSGSFGTSPEFRSYTKHNIRLSEEEKESVKVQTDPQCILQVKDIPASYRNILFQRQMLEYFSIIDEYRKNQEEDSKKKYSLKANLGKFTMKNGNGKKINLASTQSLHHSQNSEEELQFPASFRRLKDNQNHFSQTNLSSIRKTAATTHHASDIFVPDSKRKESKGILKKRVRDSFGAIKENKYENMISKDLQNSQEKVNFPEREISSSLQRVRKQWVMKPMTGEGHRNKGDVGSKRTLKKKADTLHQNKKIINQLQKLSEDFDMNYKNYELIEHNLGQNMDILTNELKKTFSKKKNNRKLPLSRQQSLCKIISAVYSYAYHLRFNHNQHMSSLIVPLFYYFKIGMGQIKRNNNYLRMLYFLSQIVGHRDQNPIFQSFITFLGHKINQEQIITVNKEVTIFYLTILQKLSIQFQFPIEVQSLYTTVQKLQQKCADLLSEEHISKNMAQQILEKVRKKVDVLMGDEEQQQRNSRQEAKLNIFKTCELIILQTQKIKETLWESYSPLLSSFDIFPNNKQLLFVKYLLNNSHFPYQNYSRALRTFEESAPVLSSIKNQEEQYRLVTKLLLRASIPDLSKFYFSILHKYKIKEEFLYLALNRRLQFVLKYINKYRADFDVERKIINHMTQQQQEKGVGKDASQKKVMALTYLRIVDHQASQLHRQLLGEDLFCLYTEPSKVNAKDILQTDI